MVISEKMQVKSRSFFKKWQEYAIVLLLFSSLFDLVSLGQIGNLSLTIPFLVTVFFIGISFFGVIAGEIKLSNRRIAIFGSMLILLCLSMIFNSYGSNLSSFSLYIYFFLIFLLVDCSNNTFDYKKWLKRYVIVLSILSIYGVYQFLAYNIIPQLPFKEIIPEFLRTAKMNVITTMHGYSLFGREATRAHSIFSEPSIFSQLSAIGIVVALFLKKEFKNSYSYILCVVCCLLGLLVSLSGTGVIIFLAGVIYLFLKSSGVKKLFMFVTILAILFIFFIQDDSDFVTYYFSRSFELIAGQSNSTSGYYRFVAPFEVGFKSVDTIFLGFGPGNDSVALSLAKIQESSISNGYGKIFVEVGIFGLICFILMFAFVRPKKNKQNDSSVLMLLFLISICMAAVSTFMMPLFWCFFVFYLYSRNSNYTKE